MDGSHFPAVPAIAAESPVELVTGRIAEAGDGRLAVVSADGPVPARPAAGCLIAPAVGDLVLMARDSDGGAWVLQVLDRVATGPRVLGGTGDLTVAADRLRLTGREIEAEAERGHLRLGSLDIAATVIRGLSRRIETTAEHVGLFVKRLVGHYGESMKVVDGTDMVKAEQITQQANGLLHQECQDSIHAARGDIRIEGERITMG